MVWPRPLALLVLAGALLLAWPGAAGAGQVPPAGQHAGTSADAAGPAPAPAHPHPQPQHPQQAQLAGGLSWFVQLSDLHINKFVHHDILPDLLAFGDAVLSGVRPQALLITGDLVDAKTRAEGSQQHVEEWQAYERAWRHLAVSAGLPAASVLDVRGNHDAFDTIRGSDKDLFTYHSATAAAHGRAAAAQQRIKVTHLLPQLLFPAQQQQQGPQAARPGSEQQQHQQQQRDQEDPEEGAGDKRGMELPRHLRHRALLTASMQQQQQQQEQQRVDSRLDMRASSSGAARRLHAGDTGPEPEVDTGKDKDADDDPAGGGAVASGGACPSAVLLGLDLAPNIGLHGPANFFGLASNDLLAELQQTLQALQPAAAAAAGDSSSGGQQYACSSGGGGMLAAAGAAAPIISYSHYPFSTVAGGWAGGVPHSSSSSKADAFAFGEDAFAARAEAAAAARAAQALGEGGRALAALLGRYDVAAHLSGHLHDLMGPHMFTKYHKEGGTAGPAAAAGRAGAAGAARYLADLEASDWKSARRWRLGAADSGSFSFADLTFRRTTNSHSSGSSSSSKQPVLLASQTSSGSGGDAGGGGYEVTSVDESRVVGGHVVLLTWPPDDRFSPLSAHQPPVQVVLPGGGSSSSSSSSGGGDGVAVRALVLPINLVGGGDGSGNSSSTAITSVTLSWGCMPRAAWKPPTSTATSSSSSSCGSAPMVPIGTPAPFAAGDSSSIPAPGSQPPYRLASPQVFGLQAPLNHAQLSQCCGTTTTSSSSSRGAAGMASLEGDVTAAGEYVLQLQVTVTAAAAAGARVRQLASLSTSELRPVRLLLPSWAEQQQQGREPLPLPSNPAEVFFLWIDGKRFADWLFYCCWGVQLAALIASRLFNRQLLVLRRKGWYLPVAAALAAEPSGPLLDSSSSSRNNGSSGNGSRHGGSYSSSGSLLGRGQQRLHDSSSRTSFSGPAAADSASSSTAGGGPRCRPFGSWVLLLLLLLLRLLLAAAAALRLLLLGVCALLLVPVVGLALVAKHHPGPWRLLLAHVAYAAVGPWFASQLGSNTPGLGLWFPYGLLLPLPGSIPPLWESGAVGTAATAAGVAGEALASSAEGGGEGVWWGFVRSADARFICGLSMLSVLAPVTLWVGMVVQAWYLRLQALGVVGLDEGGSGAYEAVRVRGKGSDEGLGGVEGGKGSGVLGQLCCEGEDEVVAVQGGVYGVTAARSSSLSNRVSPAVSGFGGSSRAAAAGDEEWQVVPLGEEGEEEGEVLFDGGYEGSQGEQDLLCEMVPLKQQQQNGPARLVRNSPPRRRKDTPVAAAGGGGADAAAAADDSASSSNGPSSRQQQQQQQEQQSRSGLPTAAAAAELLRGASQVLLLPVVTSLLPVVGTSAAVSQQQQPSAAAAAASVSISNSRGSGASQRSLWQQLPVVSTLLHWLYCGALWLRAGAALLQLAASAASLPPLPLLLLLVPPGLMWCKANWRLAAAYGPSGLLLSPVLGWLPVLLGCWLHTVRRQMGMGPAGWGCGGCCTKAAWRRRSE